ncbi:homing endonuclease [Serratia phage phiMAM1]|uniref:GIY-YIG endonuclease n=1 Tax=Serratia phage phiMAM1 TaxID=1262513 RepID=K7YIR2_9CAUD|nr:homing endonuclease [Serratia phage phiMAM1]AFX93521.1 GIY-YIG endonuclease [Serratia phage phiMAM1]
MGCVYKITNNVNGKTYIGVTTRNPEHRWWEHCNSARKGSDFFIHQAIRKYGEDQFSFQVISESNDGEELKRLEMENIKISCSHMTQNGYNKTWGGDGATFINKHGAKDPVTGEKLGLTSCDDPRWATGEIVSCVAGNTRAFSQRLSDHAKTRTGAKNSNAKKFKLISPDGVVHEIEGNCREYVERLGLKYSALYDYIDKGKPVPCPAGRYTPERMATVGWSLVRC